MCAPNGCAAVRKCSTAFLFCIIFLITYGLCLAAGSHQHAAEDLHSKGSDSSESRRDDYGGHDHPPHPFCGIEFAESYTVSIATTVPLKGSPPITQIGQLYVDKAAGAVRVDQTYRGQRTSFLVDNRHLRAFFFFDAAADDDDDAARAVNSHGGGRCDVNKDSDDRDPSQRCHVFYLPAKVAPFCVPWRYTASSRESVIRGVPVTRFSGVERYDHTPLVEQSLYVLNVTDAATPMIIPWRLEMSARADLEREKIFSAPYNGLPNWRLFGHPMFDELILSPAQESQLQFWEPVYDLLTVDFYNYYSTPLKSSVFAVPPHCTAVLRRGTSTSSGDAQSTSASAHDSPTPSTATGRLLELAMIQRFLIQWHVLQNTSVGLHVAKEVEG
ncbi:hypothetical protein JKF63_01139 [Porcisia hertigi]|uniref:Transmembrane protein n=1 Tax=Porcisia hertigi TaxID=2761500 RepID=A0A836KZ60_9TRYP|nr:hypothetical protein JKF63_01139 [Porcisia hertigi]